MVGLLRATATGPAGLPLVLTATTGTIGLLPGTGSLMTIGTAPRRTATDTAATKTGTTGTTMSTTGLMASAILAEATAAATTAESILARASADTTMMTTNYRIFAPSLGMTLVQHAGIYSISTL